MAFLFEHDPPRGGFIGRALDPLEADGERAAWPFWPVALALAAGAPGQGGVAGAGYLGLLLVVGCYGLLLATWPGRSARA